MVGLSQSLIFRNGSPEPFAATFKYTTNELRLIQEKDFSSSRSVCGVQPRLERCGTHVPSCSCCACLCFLQDRMHIFWGSLMNPWLNDEPCFWSEITTRWTLLLTSFIHYNTHTHTQVSVPTWNMVGIRCRFPAERIRKKSDWIIPSWIRNNPLLVWVYESVCVYEYTRVYVIRQKALCKHGNCCSNIKAA